MNILESIRYNTILIEPTAEFLPIGIVVYSVGNRHKELIGKQVEFDSESACYLESGMIMAHTSHITELV